MIGNHNTPSLVPRRAHSTPSRAGQARRSTQIPRLLERDIAARVGYFCAPGHPSLRCIAVVSVNEANAAEGNGFIYFQGTRDTARDRDGTLSGRF
jgi:hypothetical protein